MTAEAHPERVPDISWTHRPPPLLVPVPAYQIHPLVGKLLVITDPASKAWRYDAIAVSEVYEQRDFGKVVNILDQYDFVKATHLKLPVATTIMSVAQLWVERRYEYWDEVPSEWRPAPVPIPFGQPHLHDDVLRVDPTRPPVRITRQGNHLSGNAAVGSRLILNTPTGLQSGWRLVSLPHLHRHEGPNLLGPVESIDTPLYLQSYTICEEDEYFLWVVTGRTPPSCRTVQCGEVFFE